VLFLYSGILQIIATLIGSHVYAPLIKFPEYILKTIPGANFFKGFMPNNIYANYDKFIDFLKLGITTIAISFLILIFFYIYKEVYCYVVKLLTNFIKFLPNFAFPFSLRMKKDDQK
jgi:hypothetical protein